MKAELFNLKVLPIRNKLFRFACMLLNNVTEAEDVLQEVLMKLWIKKDDLDNIQNIEAWSITMIRNLSYDKLRKYKMNNQVGLDYTAEIPGESEEKSMNVDERIKNVYFYMKELPQRQHQVIFLRDIEGHSYKEISLIMGIDENLVKVTLFRARENLRKKVLNIENYGL